MFRRLVVAFVAVMLAGSALAGTRLVRSHLSAVVTPKVTVDVNALRARLVAAYGPQAATTATYIGSEYCMACHGPNGLGPDESSWRTTQHAATYIRPMTQWTLAPGKGVLANTLGKESDDFMQGVDFNTISSPFDAYKPNAPKLSVKNGTYTITIGQADLPVVVMLQWRFASGVWEQLFCVRIPVSDSPTGKTGAVYSSPLFWASDTGWQAYAPEAYYDSNNQPMYTSSATTAAVVANCESQDQSCVGCHATGIRSITQNGSGEWVSKAYLATLYTDGDPGYFDYNGDGTVQIMNVGCESCHGPGAQHVLGGGDKTKIVNPANLDTQGANDVCGQCHSVVASTPSGTIGWPYNETTQQAWVPGSGPLSAFFTDGEVWWPDGKTGQDTSQYPEFYKSSKPTFQFHPVRCTDCHDPMSTTSNHAQIVDQVESGTLTISTHVDDDTLCLACHATHGGGTSADFTTITAAMVADYATNRDAIGKVVSAHTNHPYAPERMMGLSRCTHCHMATTQGPDAAQVLHGHTFEAIPPQKTLKYQDQGGMPNSCALSCHATLVNAALAGSVTPGLTPDIATWDKQYDRDLASALLNYYGPSGVWWQLDIDQAPVGAASAATATTAHARCGRKHHR
ncbi:MAG: cytochrome c family protein [Acidobacteriia bacterium]|nr:cytochrome c family protein [Terriglobia bacterium]